MPTSVLLAVLAAAGLLALAPALVRRHDATERQVAEREQSTARVLPRRQRRRSVPGPRPVNTSTVLVPTLRTAAPMAESGPARGRRRPSDSTRRRRARVRGRQVSPAIRRRRRVLAALVLLNLAKLTGVIMVGPGFWVAFAVTCTLLVVYVGHLRSLSLADRRQRRADARQAAEVAALQAEVRAEQERRSAERRDAARRMAEQRESLRRAGARWSVSPTVSYRPAAHERRHRAG